MRPPDMPETVVDAALLAYARKRWRGVTSLDGATAVMLDNEVRDEAFKAALAAAYQAGVEAALPNVEWRVSVMSHRAGDPQPGRVSWSFCPSLEAARLELADAVAEGWTDPRVDTRRRGATDWEPVPDGD